MMKKIDQRQQEVILETSGKNRNKKPTSGENHL